MNRRIRPNHYRLAISQALALFLCVFLLKSPALADHAPSQVGGFMLGEHISLFQDKVEMETKLCLRYQSYLNEVEIEDVPGFKSGLVAFGVCDKPGIIVRMKLKYADESKDFFDQLFKRYKKKFGKPTEWKGDAFGVMHIWKWSFINAQGDKITLILQHNVDDPELKMGNVVKLSNYSAMDREKACFEKAEAQEHGNQPQNHANAPLKGKAMWDFFVPK